MSGYRTVIVGTDGSASSMRAVERAADKLHGDAPVYEILREARERAHAAGAQAIEERAIEGAPINALVHLAEETKADLLVVGDVGLDTVAGRLLGSVPAEVARRAKIDILIVHTAG
jgi:nucleotide-binding universal stress UspA family protein